MRINLDEDERIIAGLPKVWDQEVGFMGFFRKSKEGYLVLTNKQVVFVPKWFHLTPKDNEKYFGGEQVKVTKIDRYSEPDLDEDISEQAHSVLMPLESIVDVGVVEMRKVNFLRIKFRTNGKIKAFDFALAQSVTNYPIRQPLRFHNLDWEPWVRLIRSYLPVKS